MMTGTQVWDVIQKLRRLSGTKAKKDALSAFPEMAPYFLAAYNPYWQYYMPALKLHGMGDTEFNDGTFSILGKLCTRELGGNAAKAAIRSHSKTLNYASCQVLMCILNKSFDFGLAAKSINEVFPGLIPAHDIQLAKPFELRKCRFPCFVSPKLDGLRALFKDGKFYSRKGHELRGLTKLSEALVRNFGAAAFDGELMVPGEHFDDISGQIRSFAETPNAVFNVFDMPSGHGDFTKRYHLLTKLYWPDQVKLVPHTLAYEPHEIDIAYQIARARGYEGLIVKNPQGLYIGSRTWDWMKVKNTSTLDLKVVSTFEGQGKYEGACGGLYVDFNGVRVAVGSGLNDRQRVHWADNPDDIIGQIVEIAYQEVTPSGSLRHPRLVQIRGDL